MLLYLVKPGSSRTLCCKVYKQIGVVFRCFFPKSVLERTISGDSSVNTRRSVAKVACKAHEDHVC